MILATIHSLTSLEWILLLVALFFLASLNTLVLVCSFFLVKKRNPTFSFGKTFHIGSTLSCVVLQVAVQDPSCSCGNTRIVPVNSGILRKRSICTVIVFALIKATWSAPGQVCSHLGSPGLTIKWWNTSPTSWLIHPFCQQNCSTLQMAPGNSHKSSTYYWINQRIVQFTSIAYADMDRITLGNIHGIGEGRNCVGNGYGQLRRCESKTKLACGMGLYWALSRIIVTSDMHALG